MIHSKRVVRGAVILLAGIFVTTFYVHKNSQPEDQTLPAVSVIMKNWEQDYQQGVVPPVTSEENKNYAPTKTTLDLLRAASLFATEKKIAVSALSKFRNLKNNTVYTDLKLCRDSILKNKHIEPLFYKIPEDKSGDFKQAIALFEKAIQNKKFPADSESDYLLFSSLKKIKDPNGQDKMNDSTLEFLKSEILYSIGDRNYELPALLAYINFIFKFPNDELSSLAIMRANSLVNNLYTGSSGKDIPEDWNNFLHEINYLVSNIDERKIAESELNK
ncbi:MAG: hypothetical protein M9962_04470 [Oligoflexia bacterium]|nr:hypothetical protein [Oligoflexia bacterium]